MTSNSNDPAGNAKALLAIAKNADATPEQLAAIAGLIEAVDRLLAKHPEASQDLLERLSHSSDKATRKQVVLNSNAPKAVLVRLAPQFPGDFFKNPVFDWLLLEEPKLLFEIGGGVLKNILKRADCPQSFIEWAAARGSTQEQLAVAMNPSTPMAVLKRLAAAGGQVASVAKAHTRWHEPAPTVDPRQTLRENVRTELGKLNYWTAMKCWRKRYLGPAQWPALGLPTRMRLCNLPEDVFVKEWLSRHEEALRVQCTGWEGRRWLQDHLARQNPGVPSDACQSKRYKMAKTELAWAASIGRITPQVLRHLGPYSQRNNILSDAECPTYLLDHYAKHRDSGVRSCVASNPATPARLLVLLAADKTSCVRRAAARNPHCPAETLQTLAGDSHEEVRTSLASNPACPAGLLEHLAEDSAVSVRVYVAANPACPAEVLARLIEDDHDSVWQAVVENKACPPDLLRQMMNNAPVFFASRNRYSSDRLCHIARNPACPVDVLVQLAAPFPLAVAQNPSCPLNLLERLGESGSPDVLRAVGRNPSTSEHLRRAIYSRLIDCSTEYEIKHFIADSQCPDDLRQVAGARLWWQSMQSLAKKNQALSILDSLEKASNGRALIELLRQEADRWILHPEATWAAKLIGVGDVDVLSIDSCAADAAAASSTPVARLLGLSQPHTAPDRLAKRVRSTDWLERLAIACNPGCPSGMLAQLTTDAHAVVAAAARTTEAERQHRFDRLDEILAEIQAAPIEFEHLTRELASRLTRATHVDRLIGTRWENLLSIEQRLGIPESGSDMRLLSLLPESTTHSVWRYLMDKRYPKRGWKRIASANHADIRADAAALPGCPADLLRRFADDGSYLPRVAVAGNPGSPPELLRHLAEDSHGAVEDALEKRRSETATLLAQMPADLGADCIAWATEHSIAARIALEKPVRLPEPGIPTGTVLSQLLVLAHPAFPADKRKPLVDALARKVDAWFANPEPAQDNAQWQIDDFKEPLAALGLLPPDSDKRATAKAAKSKDWLQRAAVALAQDTQPYLLKMLLNDAVAVVRQLAAQRLRSKADASVLSAGGTA